MMEVRPYPCDPASDDYKLGPLIANNAGGLGEDADRWDSDPVAVRNARRKKPSNVTWEGITWRVAEDGGTLWVLAPSRDTVESWRPALTRLANITRDYGGLENVLKELSAGRTPMPRAEGAKPRPKASNKRLALNGITEAVRDAYAAGATAQDVRLAVLSALGLDAEAT